MKIAARAELRDRGVKPEAGAAPVVPNIVTNKYYGENIDIISKVQEILTKCIIIADLCHANSLVMFKLYFQTCKLRFNSKP
jgi:hypothetical protein